MRLAAVAVAILGLALAAAAPSASASQTLTCSFLGQFRADPAVRGPLLVGGSEYDLGAAPRCSYSNTAAGVHVPDAAGSMVSSGKLTWAWCGLAGMDLFGDGQTFSLGVGTRVEFSDPRVPDIHQLDYQIHLAGWEGSLRGGNLMQVQGRGYGSLNNDTAWSVTGVAETQPSYATSLRDDCIRTPFEFWELRGAFTAVKP
ncbi:MAG TPA: hypothetical protein VF529_10555 [Solirubrobacteraceae bacterium]